MLPNNYPAFLPNGLVEILHSEHKIVNFINQYREKGYPIPVNLRWFWLRGDEERLFIPKDKIWDEVEEISWKNFQTIVSKGNLDDYEKQIYKKFIEFLYFDSNQLLTMIEAIHIN